MNGYEGCERERMTRKRILCFVLAVSALACAMAADSRAGIKAGAAQRDITIPELIGNPTVHDRLYARALVLNDGKSKVAIVGMDTCLPGAGWGYASGQERFRGRTGGQCLKRIRKELGFEHVLINTSHTHSDGRGKRKGTWFERCEQLLFEVVKQADQNSPGNGQRY